MDNGDRIKVLIAEDHPIVRDGLRMLLRSYSDMEVVAEATDGDEAVEKALQHHPDVVLMDVAMPKMSGIEATRAIKEREPDIKILTLTVHDSQDYFFRIVQAGASGYILKGDTSSELVAAIRAVQRGGVFLSPLVAKRLMEDYLRRVASGEENASYNGLTEREREVLKLIAQGHTNQEVADLLSISPYTVQTHRAHIMEKLNLHSRSDLIRFAIKKGLIDMSA
ncbi:MAG: response regulator transcription factor [Chloroflexi bacterium]|nr:response regulator transcription factor [Chloroflexota bacterium]